MEQLERLLEAALEAPARKVGELELLGGEERRRVVEEFNAPRSGLAKERTLPEWLDAAIARWPDRMAVEDGAGRSLTYRDLHARADEIARRLAGMGASPERIVGVCLERSCEMVAALVAVVKAGAAYLPLDIKLPPERMATLLETSQASLLITDSRLLPAIPVSRPPVILLDAPEIGPPDIDPPCSKPLRRPDARNVAYVLYTSGSTGKPKPVAIEHGSVSALLAWSLGTFDPADFAAVLAGTSTSFDLSIFEIFATLASGGRVLVVENPLEFDAIRTAPTLINTVPSVIVEMLRRQAIPA